MTDSKDENNRADGVYAGVEFYVDRWWKFVVPALAREFDNFESMKTAIDGNAKELAAAARRRLSIPVLDGHGDPVLLTGIHAGHGGFLSTPAVTSHTYQIFPDCELSRALFAEVDRLTFEIKHARKALKTIEVSKFEAGYGAKRWELIHAEEVGRVTRQLEAARKRCEKLKTVQAILGDTPEPSERDGISLD